MAYIVIGVVLESVQVVGRWAVDFILYIWCDRALVEGFVANVPGGVEDHS